MPVNDNSLGVKLVSEFHNNGVSGFSLDGRPWKLAIDTHHNMPDNPEISVGKIAL